MIKTCIMLQKIYIPDKCCSSVLSIHQRNLHKMLLYCFHHHNNKCVFFVAANQNDFGKDDVTGVMMLEKLL